MSKDRLESSYFRVAPDVELHYIEKGEGDPIVFIPGLTFSGDIFMSQIEYFGDRYRAIAIDPRGQGFSSKPVDGNDYQTHGKDLAAFIDGLDLENVTLVGWSTGNLDTWSYVEQYGTGKLNKIATIDMSPLPLSADPNWWTEGTIDELSEVATKCLNTPQGTRDFFSDYATEIMIQHKMDPGELEYILDMSARTPYWIAKALFCDAIYSNYLDTAKELGKDFPSMMFIAEHWADVAEPFVKKELPGYETHVMGGHLMFYEYPDEWDKVFEDFLAE